MAEGRLVSYVSSDNFGAKCLRDVSVVCDICLLRKPTYEAIQAVNISELREYS